MEALLSQLDSLDSISPQTHLASMVKNPEQPSCHLQSPVELEYYGTPTSNSESHHNRTLTELQDLTLGMKSLARIKSSPVTLLSTRSRLIGRRISTFKIISPHRVVDISDLGAVPFFAFEKSGFSIADSKEYRIHAVKNYRA